MTEQIFLGWQAAKESSSTELEAAKRHVRDLQLNAQTNEEASYAQVARLVDERDTLKAEKEALEKRLAWWESPHDAEQFEAIKNQASYQDSLCAQTIYIGHLERHVKELTKLLAAARKEGFEEGKQAGRDELQAKVDALMFEYCPEDVTHEQIAEYEKHQRPLPPTVKEK
jgi:hypothetical protein